MSRLLDLFCGAGGATRGYQSAGFRVMGVDIAAQPTYIGDKFFLGDVFRLGHWAPGAFHVIHASPPCQFGTAYRRRPNHVKDSPNLIPEVRELLITTGLPYVIEQPWTNRAELKNPIMLCGSMFGLDVQRHRVFETNFDLGPQPTCDHSIWTPRFPPATNRTNLRKTVEVGVWRIPLETQKQAMGVDWDCTLHELSEMVPPAYTEWIGARIPR